MLAIVPVKRLELAKHRLAGVLDSPERTALTLAMLADVLLVLRCVKAIDTVVVIGSDEAVAATAEQYGAQFIAEPVGAEGLNGAIRHVVAVIAGAEAPALVLPADVPAVTCEDVQRLIQAAPAPGIALVRAADGGTNALVLWPSRIIAPAFGDQSADQHQAQAAAVGVSARELVLPSLTCDVDGPGDLYSVAMAPTLGQNTRALLEAWGKQAFPISQTQQAAP